MTETATERGGIQVIARAAAVLRALEGEPEGLSLGDIAQRVDLPRSTVQRIVGALASERLLAAASPGARVRLGPALARLGSAATIDIEQAAQPILERLSKEVEETVDLSTLSGTAATFLYQVPGSHRLRAVSAVGEKFPLYCTANGKALLATMPDTKSRKIIEGSLTRLTEHTITDRALLASQIDAIRRGEVARDDEEHTDGISALGVALYDAANRPYAISIPVPTSRFKRIVAHLHRPLLDARDMLVDKIGGSVPTYE